MVPDSSLALHAAIGLVAVGRQFVYSTFFATLQRSCHPSHYGKLAGTANLCVAAFGAFQPTLVAISSDTSEGALQFIRANGLFLLLCLALLTQPLRCWHDTEDKAAGKLTPAAEPPQESAGSKPLATLRVALLPKNSPSYP